MVQLQQLGPSYRVSNPVDRAIIGPSGCLETKSTRLVGQLVVQTVAAIIHKDKIL